MVNSRALTIGIELSAALEIIGMERFIPVECFRKKVILLRYPLFLAFTGINGSFWSVAFVHTYQLTSARPFKVILARKNAKHLQDGGRFLKLVSMQCVSFLKVVFGDVLKQHNCNLQVKKNEVLWSVLVFSFTCMIRDSSVLLSYIEGKHYGCWLLVLLTKLRSCSNQADEIVFLSKKTIILQVVRWNV